MEEKKEAREEGTQQKARTSRWVIGGLLVFMLGMFIAGATPYGLAVWWGDAEQQMSARIKETQLHHEVEPLTQVFHIPVAPREMYWREVKVLKTFLGTDNEDKTLWAVLHYDEAGFEALLAPLPAGELADVKKFASWFLKDVEKNMKLPLPPETEVHKLPSEEFARGATSPKTMGAYVVPSQKSLVLMRFGAADFLVKP